MTSRTHAIAVLLAAMAAAAVVSGRVAAQNRDSAPSRLVWAAKPVPPTSYVAPNRLATRLAITPRNKEGQVHYWQPDVQECAPFGVRPPRR